MAIIVMGKSNCFICGQLLGDDDELVVFPAFAVNELDPLYPFSDSGVHKNCLQNHELGNEAVRRRNAFLSNTGPGKRICAVCDKEVMDPDNYFLIEGLPDTIENLKHYNYTHLHVSCIKNWPEKKNILKPLKNLASSGLWKGAYLDQLIATIETVSDG